MSPLVSKNTVTEIIRVLSYPKFKLTASELEILLSDYLSYVKTVEVSPLKTSPQCRDKADQVFVDLSIKGKAKVLITGDNDLLVMDIGIPIETPAQYQERVNA